MIVRSLVSILLLVSSTLHASASFVDFNTSFQSLPYSESGLTFFTLPGTNSAVVSSGHMGSGTNFTPIHIRATADRPFSLVSLDIPRFTREWQITSSSGAVLPLASTGVISFAELSGWSNIAYFDLVHDPAQPNGSIQVDRVDFEIDSNALAGDFDTNGTVNAADYVTWRSKIRTQAGYAAWRSNFGAAVDDGANPGAVVPEPAAFFSAVVAIAAIATRRRPTAYLVWGMSRRSMGAVSAPG